jgi:purine-binding chemotaxis protein CheW
MGAMKAEHAPFAAKRAVVFRVADQAYALPLHFVREILPMAWLSRPPGLPPVLAGFLNLRGTAVPVVRLAYLLGLVEPPPGLYTPLIHVRCHDTPLLLLVDAVVGIFPFDESEVVPLHQNRCFNNCAVGLMTCGQTTVVLLSEERLLREEERIRLGELAAIEQSRLSKLEWVESERAEVREAVHDALVAD